MLANRRRLAITFVGVCAFLISAFLSLLVRFPQPRVHDEFSYLLTADTFAHGRITNPTHPMWMHFESIHVIQQPTYASKYPPGQGVFLAAGKIIGHPIAGVWLSTALGCAAICWMLMGWLTPRWALFGGILAFIHPMVLAWGQSYWGGAVAMGGGALVLGAVRRMATAPKPSTGIVLGIGLAVLAISRPYEGILLGVALAAALLPRVWSQVSRSRLIWLRHVVLPVGLILAVTAVAMGYYNKQVTGTVFQMPYMVYQKAYAFVPLFVFQHLGPEPVYRHREIQYAHAVWELSYYQDQRSISGLVLWSLGKILVLLVGYFSLFGLALAAVALPVVFEKNQWMRFALLVCGLFVAGLLMETWMQAHYAAPITGLVLLFGVQSMRQMRLWRWRGWRAGRSMFAACLLLCLVSFFTFYRDLSRQGRLDRKDWSVQRAELSNVLAQDGSRHLLIVRYGPDHNPLEEWVYNDADIDNAPVIWARDMGEQNVALLDYFKDRRIWLLEINSDAPELVQYSLAARQK